MSQPTANRGASVNPAVLPSESDQQPRGRLHPIKIVAVVLILFGVAILVYPFIPLFHYVLFKPSPQYPYATQLTDDQLTRPIDNSGHLPKIGSRLPEESRLVIPKIGVNMPIVEGADERSLFRGSWRIPSTSTPDLGGNTVLTVHRFQYLAGPNTLALADRLAKDDIIIVYWKNGEGIQEYDYRIISTELVEPTRTEILNNTEEPKLTLFTCAPMFSTKYRLVLHAEPFTATNPETT